MMKMVSQKYLQNHIENDIWFSHGILYSNFNNQSVLNFFQIKETYFDGEN